MPRSAPVRLNNVGPPRCAAVQAACRYSFDQTAPGSRSAGSVPVAARHDRVDVAMVAIAPAVRAVLCGSRTRSARARHCPLAGRSASGQAVGLQQPWMLCCVDWKRRFRQVSEAGGEFTEGEADTITWRYVKGEFVVAASKVLYERVPGAVFDAERMRLSPRIRCSLSLSRPWLVSTLLAYCSTNMPRTGNAFVEHPWVDRRPVGRDLDRNRSEPHRAGDERTRRVKRRPPATVAMVVMDMAQRSLWLRERPWSPCWPDVPARSRTGLAAPPRQFVAGGCGRRRGCGSQVSRRSTGAQLPASDHARARHHHRAPRAFTTPLTADPLRRLLKRSLRTGSGLSPPRQRRGRVRRSRCRQPCVVDH